MAAALAFVSPSALAQDAAAPAMTSAAPGPVPEIVVPDIPAPTAPEPTIALPVDEPEPAPADASEEPAPVAAAAPRTASRSAANPPAAAEPLSEAAEPAPAGEPIATTVESSTPAAAGSLPPASIDEPAEAEPRIETGLLALMLGSLVFLALAIWGFIAIGRRKPVRRYAAVAPAPEARPPVASGDVRSEPVVADTAPAPRVVEPLITPTAAAGLPHAGASVALPRRLPDSFEDRESLFRRMVDARPDRANPFVDRRARMKRARLIMQSLGRDFGDTEPWIDLSQYPHNWPELARNRSAAA